MIFNMVGGGGTSLNFDVVAYASETALKAAKPKENTIGIVTTTAINGWVFSAEAPTSYSSGMVWIKVGDSSEVAFNALKKNDLQVYPIGSYQWSGSSWMQRTAYIYQSDVWNGMNFLILYDSGAFSNGYDIEKTSDAYDANDSLALSKQTDHIQLTASGDFWAMYYINPKVCPDGFNTLSIQIESASMSIDSGEGKFGLSSNISAASPSYVAEKTFSTFSGNKTFSVDVSSLTGTATYYIAFRFGLSNGATFSAKIKKIWLE